MIQNNESTTILRVLDIMNIAPAITGKVELVYEGEQEGADFVAQELIKKAVLNTFEQHFHKIEKLERRKEVLRCMTNYIPGFLKTIQ